MHSGKRCRVVQSSSSGRLGDLFRLKPIKFPEAPTAQNRVQNEAEPVNVGVLQPRRSIFTLPSLDREESNNGHVEKANEPNWDFPRPCTHCKDIIFEDDNVFMYGYLQAFCSPQCRDVQIALDDERNKPSPQPTVPQN